jgi:hypothetical protein
MRQAFGMLVEVFLEGLGIESSCKRKGVEAGNEIEKLSHHSNLEKKVIGWAC